MVETSVDQEKQLFSYAAQVMETQSGRMFMAALLEICDHEVPAFGTNAAVMANHAAKQEIAYTVKDWVWQGGGKQNWRRMEDTIDITAEIVEEEEEKLESEN
jgi:hypothetical protein